MNTTIRFLRPNRYGKPVNALDSQMGYGVHQLLVQRGIAEFVREPEPVESEPVRERKPRRSKETET